MAWVLACCSAAGGCWMLLLHSRSAHSTAVLNLLHSATVTLASAGRRARLKRKLTAAALESWTIESSSSRRRQPNSERRTRSGTHTVNLPLLPADTANDAYGPQNRHEKTYLGPESSFSLNLYVQSLRPAHSSVPACLAGRATS
jgi:hypothetical protein